MPRITVIGAGAAGCFCAIELKRRLPEAEVIVLEAGKQPMAKLALTGGGRCNLTNTFEGIRDLREAYPRGHQWMKRGLRQFGPRDTMRWFEAEGVSLKQEAGGRIFPVSDDAMQIVRTLRHAMDRSGVRLHTGERITDIRPLMADSDAVVVATGGSPKRTGLAFLDPLGLEIEEPVPSLFTFRIEDPGIRALMGSVAPAVILSLLGTPFKAAGPLLLTDWGLSGPAALRLSSYAARHLAECGYRAPLAVNWSGANEQSVREQLSGTAERNAQRMAVHTPLFDLPSRLWAQLLQRSALRADIRWAEMGGKGLNRLVSTLTNDPYEISGRAAFKEEFVTCGGVSLRNLDPLTLGARQHPGLFLAGEVLDIDAVTGGFNLQAAWTTGWICARSIAEYLKK